MIPDDVEKALKVIESVLDTSTVGYPNERAKQLIEAAISTIRYSDIRDGYVSEKLAALSNWSDIVFSTRKHEKISGGARWIKYEMLSLCDRIRTQCKDSQ